jgi:hypothetical protein
LVFQIYMPAVMSQHLQHLKSMRPRQGWVLPGVLQPAVEDEAEEAALQPFVDRVLLYGLNILPLVNLCLPC